MLDSLPLFLAFQGYLLPICVPSGHPWGSAFEHCCDFAVTQRDQVFIFVRAENLALRAKDHFVGDEN